MVINLSGMVTYFFLYHFKAASLEFSEQLMDNTVLFNPFLSKFLFHPFKPTPLANCSKLFYAHGETYSAISFPQ
jgi:hypothetical protein